MWENLKVVELAGVLAGPSVGMFFAELGAQVIKIENSVTSGDMTRKWKLPSESKTSNVSAYFSSVNYHKSYITLNLKNEEDRKIVHQHIKEADIVLTNFKPGSAEKFQMDFDFLKQLNPILIYGEITGFSETSQRPAFDVVLQAESGFMSMNGERNGPPVKMPVALIDVLAAHQLKEGILVAMLQQVKTQKAYKVSVSLFDAALASLVNQASNYLMNDHIPERIGSAHPNIAPYGDLFKTKDDRYIVLAIGTDKHFQLLCKILNVEVTDPFLSNHKRVQNRKSLIDTLQDKVKNWNSGELLNQLFEQKIPVGLVKNMKEVFDSSQAQELVLEEQIEDRLTKRVKSTVFKIYS